MLSNFSFVIPEKLAGCAHPGWGSHLEANVRELAMQYGITRLVTLTEDPVDPSVLERAGLGWRHFPIEDMEAPELQSAAHLVGEILEEIEQGGRVVVHCLGGYGRTGTILACCLVAAGRTSYEALQAVRRLRPGSVETPRQERFIADFEKWWRKAGTAEDPGARPGG